MAVSSSRSLVSICAFFLLACTDPPAEDVGEGETEAGDGDGDGDPGDGDGDGEALRPNWHEDVAPLVTAACQGCHQDGGIAPFTLQTYPQAAGWSSLIADVVESRQMPPWHALETAECQPPHAFKHDARLSAAQIQLLRDWADLGAPEGDPELAAPLPEPPSLDLQNPTTTVLMQTPLSIQAQGPFLDSFHCISLDPGNAQDVFLTGLQVIPGNRAIVHHVLVYVDENAASASWTGGVKQNCGGGTGIGGAAQLIAGWVPGGLPMEPPAGVGISVPAGARLILNVHYHATGAGAEIDDSTGLALRWTTTEPDYSSFFTLLGAPGIGDSLTGPLSIAPNAKGHIEEYEWAISVNGQAFPDIVEARVWAIANHMHKVGVDMRVAVEDRDTGVETCLLQTPKWDFNWQRVYEYDAAANQGFRVKAGDIVRIRCTYDNTLDNPGVVEALAELGLTEPVQVNMGEGSLDEMCLTAVGVGVRLP